MDSAPAMRASRNPQKDKLHDEIAVNLTLADDLDRIATTLRSRNERLRALARDTRPYGQSNSPAATNDEAA